MTLVGLSVKTLVAATLTIVLFGVYIGVLMYGENSLTVLQHVKAEKRSLLHEVQVLKIENQKLQKVYFELKQLEPKD